MEIEVPYLVFEVNRNEYMIDAYFSKKLDQFVKAYRANLGHLPNIHHRHPISSFSNIIQVVFY
ncbi:MAG TPA: hypothetical protein EYH13_01860 [Thermococcus paralvinellae]|uniref:Uncharacterized protein n=1 Tax=Thermococcus paralvinellae TaxID=582419 RepID=A0A832Z9A2_9EURY|nr:hypothetical protein [Thermococcus paralvinellae]